MDFSILPQIIIPGGSPEEEQEKMTILNNFLTNDPMGLLISLSQLIISSDEQQIIEKASLLIHGPISKLQKLRPDLSLLPQIYQISDGLFETLFNKSVECINAYENTHPYCVVAEICIGQYLEADLNEEATSMINILCQLLNENTTLKIAVALAEIFKNITDQYALDPAQYEPIITTIFNILNEQSLTKAHKDCLIAFLELIEYIEPIFQSDDNRNTIFQLLQ